MGAFRKFDPRAFRQTQFQPVPPAKPAKVAKPSWPERSFSSFSNFSRAIVPARDSWTPSDWQAYFDERAAISEFDGGLVRLEAERLAYEDALAHWLSMHPPSPTPHDRCMHCGEADRPHDMLLPMLAVGGHTWIHDNCWTAWDGARRREGLAFLEAVGLPAPLASSSGELP